MLCKSYNTVCRTLALCVIYLLSILAPCNAVAQDDDIYRMEIGGGIGVVSYLGDFDGSLFGNLQPIGTIMARYVLDPHSALKMNVSYGKLKVNTANEKGYVMWREEHGDVEFSRSLVDVGFGYEYNFWQYGTGREYRGARPIAPYMSIGLGLSVASGGGVEGLKNGTALKMPVGFGVKYKVAPRINVGLEYMMHFSTGDKLDGIADPQHIKSSGIFKNTDCYGTLQLSLTYDFWAKCRTCNKAD